MLKITLAFIILGNFHSSNSENIISFKTDQGTNSDWRNQSKCGVNALYVILKSDGFLIDYNHLLTQANLTSEGASLYELQRLAKLYGKNITPVKLTLSSINSLKLPFIIHTENQNFLKHYLILTSVEAGKYQILDATSGEFFNWEAADMNDKWTGYAIGEINYFANFNYLSVSMGVLLFSYMIIKIIFPIPTQKVSEKFSLATIPNERR